MSRLSPAKLAVAARTARAVLMARWVLRRGGFPAALRHYGLEALVERPSSAFPARRPADLDPATLRVSFRVLRLPVLGSTCLPTSLALAQVLRRRGQEPDVVIGVDSGQDGFSAHAWVEVEGYRLDVSEGPPDAHREIGRFRSTGAVPR